MRLCAILYYTYKRIHIFIYILNVRACNTIGDEGRGGRGLVEGRDGGRIIKRIDRGEKKIRIVIIVASLCTIIILYMQWRGVNDTSGIKNTVRLR